MIVVLVPGKVNIVRDDDMMTKECVSICYDYFLTEVAFYHCR